MNIMNLNDEQRKRLEEELQSLRNTPVKPCKWSLKNRLEYGTRFYGLQIGKWRSEYGGIFDRMWHIN